MLIRPEQADDFDAVLALNVVAFGSPTEARLVDRLRDLCVDAVSLVAVDGGELVGHIFFSPVILARDDSVKLYGLGPMAVAPARQRQGIGTALVERGLERCRSLGADAVVVLGHPGFYPRFGFAPASRFGLDCDFPAPDDAFMVLELRTAALRGKTGRIKYHPAFDEA